MICMPTIRSMTTRSRLEQLNTCPPEAFCAALADLWEHAPWVAQGVVGQRPFATADALHTAMVDVVAPQPPQSIITADLEAALKQFAAIAEDLK